MTEAPAIQQFSHYPALPPPVDVRLVRLPGHACPYLPGRTASDRAILADTLDPVLYERFMDCGFRRSGRLLYQPACVGCRQCRPIRVPVAGFRPDKSQRRCRGRNADLRVTSHAPRCSTEKFELYRKYLRLWHDRADREDPADFECFLYDSPVATTVEFEYRDAASRLLAVGICDLCPRALSSVYFYFDPDEARRGLGTFGALYEIDFAAQAGLTHYYLGYWVDGCRTMQYKTDFRPYELLHGDGAWRAPSR